ncbi:MAG: UDP-3-O-acyl-N-acetylglucosamine deacetylase [Proteobacteria bacterium]|nr:UDP-3-O-acyl-N-acetylglucosamine deacetylase [Pseudomonadota bacterium]
MKTTLKDIVITGVGIHSGMPVRMAIKRSDRPGIFFRRADLPGAAPIHARWDNVTATGLWSTSVGRAPNIVHTTEHLMAALFVCGIDSAVIEIDGSEVPIMDGSAKEFIELIGNAWGARPQSSLKKIIVKKPVVAFRSEIIKKMSVFSRFALWLHNLKTGRREDGFVRLAPNPDGLLIRATLVYPDKIIGTQSAEILFDGTDESREKFLTEFAATRTFGRIWEWGHMKKRGMGRGANEHNVIALNQDSSGTLNKLQCPDEFVRHKIIDAAGDMFASGGWVFGTLESYKGSHALNNLVLKKLFAHPDNYDIIEGI